MTTATKAGRYELREELGRGAMGVVYRAHDPVIGRDVAVKTMHLSEAGTGMSREELVSRFQTEARAAGLLTHPNIVVIHDAGEEEGLFYITMELVEGRSLQTLLDARQLFPLPRVTRLMEQICSALDFAHQHNVVHRDIKPANLVLTADDTVKITDFGTAKILQFGTAQTAHVMGTPSYMSPEQVKGKPVDGRSDIFSLGVILYELMTGEKPFPGQNITTVIYKIINEEPIPPRSLDSSIHQGLSSVITRALAKNPNERYQNCHELMDALRNYRELVIPEATVRMAPVTAQPAPTVVRTPAPPPHPPSAAAGARPKDAETPVRVISPALMQAEESSKNRGTLLLSLVLLGVIGYAGYRIWPPMMDLWQRAHQPVDGPAVQSKPIATPPVAVPALPDSKSESKSEQSSDALPPVPTTTADVTEDSAAPQAARAASPAATQEAASTSTAKPAAQETSPVGSTVKKTATPVKVTPAPTEEANEVASRLRKELAVMELSEKVRIQVAANTLTLSGRLTAREHRMLVNHLHWVPADVPLVDHLEYTEPRNAVQPSATKAAATVGWLWVRSNPQGAKILVDATDTGLHTPARVELPEGTHSVQLTLHGFADANRTVLIEAGQSMQYTALLGQP